MLHHGIAEGAGQSFQNRSAQHQRLGRRVVRLEYLCHQVIHHVTVRAAKCAHERVAVGGGRQRKGGEIEPSRPSLRLGDQSVDIFGCEVEPEAAVEEGVRLLGGEPQVVGS